jgi:hypothetical protein
MMKNRVSTSQTLARERERQEVLGLRDRRRRLNLRTLVGVGLAIAYFVAAHGADLARVLTQIV